MLKDYSLELDLLRQQEGGGLYCLTHITVPITGRVAKQSTQVKLITFPKQLFE